MAEQVNSALVRALTVTSTGRTSISAAAGNDHKMMRTVMVDSLYLGTVLQLVVC